jgi:RimJ/RimL family protein N-acetyltransferase
MSTPGRALLAAVKATATARGPNLTVPVGEPVESILRPVSIRRDSLCEADVARLTGWRNRFVHVFLTEFEATNERTADWLVETVGPDDTRIIFMVDTPDGRTFGYMGLAFIDWDHGTYQLDGIVRGGAAAPGMMSNALRTMMLWARSQLGLQEARVRVRSDNPAALAFYRKIGFTEVGRAPLQRIEEPSMIRWIEDPVAPRANPCLVHMRWSPDLPAAGG